MAIEDTETSPTFIQGMRNRMVVSYYKYGAVADSVGKIDTIQCLMQRLRLYSRGDEARGIKPGNTEYLIDAANFAMMEFMYPRHPDAHFQATDDAGSPGRVALATGRPDMRPNTELKPLDGD